MACQMKYPHIFQFFLLKFLDHPDLFHIITIFMAVVVVLEAMSAREGKLQWVSTRD